MKTKLVSLTWRGSSSADPRFSTPMLPWTIGDICRREIFSKLSVGIDNGILEAYNSDFELQYQHHLKYIIGMCKIIARESYNGRHKCNDFSTVSTKTPKEDCIFTRMIGPHHGMVYLVKDPNDPLLHIYLYECDCVEEMTELMHQMRDPIHTLGGSVGNIPSTFISSSRSGSDLSIQRTLRKHGVVSGIGLNATPASNLKLTESIRHAYHDGSPNVISKLSKMSTSKSYTSGLSNSSGTVHVTTQNIGNNALSIGDISPNNSQFFEVMYVGKIKVSHKRVPFTFIDDALPKFKAYDAQKIKFQADVARRLSNASAVGSSESLSNISKKSNSITLLTDEELQNSDTVNRSENEIDQQDEVPNDDSINISSASDLKNTSAANDTTTTPEKDEEFKDKILNTKISEENKENNLPTTPTITTPTIIPGKHKLLLRGQTQVSLIKSDQTVYFVPPPSSSKQIDMIPKQRDRSASIGSIPVVEQNRTMVFLVGKTDLRLISPDRKQVLLHKDFKDVVNCVQGQKNVDHFGIICREHHHNSGGDTNGGGGSGYIGYVFKCQSKTVADYIITAISQAFQSRAEQKDKERNQQIFSCEHCPMLWYHKLCSDIEHLSDKKRQVMIFRRIELLSYEEQHFVIDKYYGAEGMTHNSTGEQNEFLMMLLRAHCESKQQRHVHDTAENRTEFLNQYLGGSTTIFTKAKRSLTSSFDHLLKRKNSKDDFGLNNNNSSTGATNNSGAAKSDTKDNIQIAIEKNRRKDLEKVDGMRPRASSFGSASISLTHNSNNEKVKSPMMDIFIKVGNSPKASSPNQTTGSWRQEILNRVVTPSRKTKIINDTQYMTPRGNDMNKIGTSRKRTKSELRELWQTAIKQTILLARMEKENARLQARQNEHELKKIKLDYDEIKICDKQALEQWEVFLEKETRITNKRDPKVLFQAIKNGVPRTKRGDIWIFLAEQWSINQAPIDTKKFPNFNTPYKTLLKNLTEHQHAIFIDLGRTFPNHKFYKPSLGIGQLSLFNMLKAYSILDPELGYCQGLGFICGVLLLHCEEDEAFNLLKHLMFCRQMRNKYLPDMKKFQLQLYQLSRLVKDYIPNLYSWLDENEVSPTLYASPWILTVFSSQFPLGFVSRIFDFIFLESSDVIFRVAVALLDVHKDELLKCENFEEIMDFLKNIIPKIDSDILDKIMKKVFSMDINKQMSEYQVEYNVLQEEISTTNHHLEALKKVKENNQHLETQLQFAQTSIVQLEKTRNTQQHQIQNLQSQVESLELTVDRLGQFVSQLIDRNHSIELPGDIRRIIQQIDYVEPHRKKNSTTSSATSSATSTSSSSSTSSYSDRKIGKSTSVNAQIGYPLKVLEELNENTEKDCHHSMSINERTKKSLFENTYQQMRSQNRLRPNRLDSSNSSSIFKLPEHVEKAIENMPTSSVTTTNEKIETSSTTTPIATETSVTTIPTSLTPDESDSGIATPIISPSTYTTQIKIIAEDFSSNNSTTSTMDMHPLSYLGDVNFKFNGTTQLKSLKSIKSKNSSTSPYNSNQDISRIENS